MCFVHRDYHNSGKMIFNSFFNSETSLVQQLPNCITRPVCNCFESFKQLNIAKCDKDTYISKSIEQVEYFIHVTKVHHNKETIIELPYTCKVPARIIRRMVYFMNYTRRKFHLEVQSDNTVYIDFPSKSIQITQYLHHLFMYHIYLDSVITILLSPESELNIKSLGEILKIHLELLFIFQQYCNLKKYGFTFATITRNGTTNQYQLFIIPK